MTLRSPLRCLAVLSGVRSVPSRHCLRQLLPSSSSRFHSQVPLPPLLSSASPAQSFPKTSFLGHGRFVVPGCHVCDMSCSYSSEYWIAKLRQGRVCMPPSRGFSSGSDSCSASRDLAAKKCVPCNSKDMRPMSEESANGLLAQVEGWNLVNEDGTLKLSQVWKVKSFTKGLELFQLVANIAEAEGHHPDLHLVGWNNVKIDIWTHSVGGLTENDFILAAKISSLSFQHLLRKKST